MLLEKFREISSTIENQYIKDFTSQGGKVVGCCYSQVPVPEIYHAAGLLCIRLRANNITATTIGDSYFGPVICSFPKSLLQMAGEGHYHFLSGLITSSNCDSLRRLDDCWRKAATDHPDILPEFYQYFAVPHKKFDFCLKWFTDELRLHIDRLEDYFGVTIDNHRLVDSIKLYNRGRNLLRQLDELRRADDAPISGSDALAVFIAATALPMETFVELATALLDELAGSERSLPGRRLFIAGSVNDDPAFYETIEAAGAVIVGDMMSFGSKMYDTMIEENGEDPVADLARGYLGNLNHPRMFGGYKNRLKVIREKIKACRAEGVLLQNIRFCDLHGCENSLFERDLGAEGVPCFKLEREYGPLVETGRVRMRVQAFLENLPDKTISDGKNDEKRVRTISL